MLKTFSKYAHVAATLGLALSLAALPAHAKPSASFKSGFSSQRSSSSAPSKGGFGSFSNRSSSRSAGADGGAAGKSRGGFGSFGAAPASESRRSDSALSRKLDRESSEANALRTLDQRRAAQAAREAGDGRDGMRGGGRHMPDSAPRDARTPPAPGYGYNNGYGNAPAQPPVIVNQGGGISMGQVIAGAVIANSVANAHARNNNGNSHGNGNGNDNDNGGYYPAPGGDAGNLANQAGAGSVGGTAAAPAAPAAPASPASPKAAASGGSVFGSIIWLGVLALLGWAVYRVWKRARARRAADKPNYSFERN